MSRVEILQVADAVAREKNMDKEVIIQAIEQAIQKAGRSKYGHEHDIRCHIDRRTGDTELKRYRTVTETSLIENEAAQITLDQAKREKPDAKVGDILEVRVYGIDKEKGRIQLEKVIKIGRAHV